MIIYVYYNGMHLGKLIGRVSKIGQILFRSPNCFFLLKIPRQFIVPIPTLCCLLYPTEKCPVIGWMMILILQSACNSFGSC